VEERVFKGFVVGLELAWRGCRLYLEGPELGLRPGDTIQLKVDWSKVLVLEDSQGAAPPSLEAPRAH